MGRVLSFQKNHAEATAELGRAVELEPSRAELRDEYGSLLVQGQQNEKAVEQFSEALRLSPDFGQAKLHLGLLRWQQQQLDEAQKLLESAAALLPESAQAHFYLARVLEDRGARDQAVREFQAAVKLQPDWPEAQTRLGQLLQRQNDIEAALRALRRAAELQPDNPDAHNNLGLAMVQAGQAPQSVAEFQVCFAIAARGPGLSRKSGDGVSSASRLRYRHYTIPDSAESHSRRCHSALQPRTCAEVEGSIAGGAGGIAQSGGTGSVTARRSLHAGCHAVAAGCVR